MSNLKLNFKLLIKLFRPTGILRPPITRVESTTWPWHWTIGLTWWLRYYCAHMTPY